MVHRIKFLPAELNIEVTHGANLMDVLRNNGLSIDAPCGGNGKCGKCRVLINGEEALACQTYVDRDLTVTLPAITYQLTTKEGSLVPSPSPGEYALAYDIGTTTVVGYLLDLKTGTTVLHQSCLNPQTAYGADVISRIRYATTGRMDDLTGCIRKCVEEMTMELCGQFGIETEHIVTVSIVGNPAMRQLFLGIEPRNLAQVPFSPVLVSGFTVQANAYIPCLKEASLVMPPDISGFVGADTVACMLATEFDSTEELTLLVDIGTNGEMVLGNRHRRVTCSTAAGPALEGANIHFGTRAQHGAIDHVFFCNSQFQFSVIGDCKPIGICGSGLIDAVAAALDAGLLNERGRILSDDHVIRLTDKVYLTQDDIRQVQTAKGAIAAGICLMAEHLGVTTHDIQKVILSGAFGNYMDAGAACRIGLLPAELEDKIKSVGNAAGDGAKILALRPSQLPRCENIAKDTEFLELASLAGFQRCFAEKMRFEPPVTYWIRKAVHIGFSYASPLNISTLLPRQDVRDMCAADKCKAYGRNWTCPPMCGSLEECGAKMASFSRGILLQTIGTMEKRIDTAAYRLTEQKHLEQFHRLAAAIRSRYPDALCLGSGGCRICPLCAWPDPCRFPEKACSSMEAYGLFVTQVCRDNNCDYYHGDRTITYTACVLF